MIIFNSFFKPVDTLMGFLAEALYSQDKKDRAVELMKSILADEEIREGVAEDVVIKSEVKDKLAEWGVE